MYRAVALYYLENDISPNDNSSSVNALNDINISIETIEGHFAIFLNGKNVTARIVSLDVSSIVSEVAAISEVRKKLVSIQKQLGENKGVVMDGRDIGTVVFPESELKLFITASIEVRTERRFLELKSKNMAESREKVRANLIHRDHIDSTREDSPLIQAEDAILLDNSFMDQEEQLFIALKLANEKLEV